MKVTVTLTLCLLRASISYGASEASEPKAGSHQSEFSLKEEDFENTELVDLLERLFDKEKAGTNSSDLLKDMRKRLPEDQVPFMFGFEDMRERSLAGDNPLKSYHCYDAEKFEEFEKNKGILRKIYNYEQKRIKRNQQYQSSQGTKKKTFPEEYYDLLLILHAKKMSEPFDDDNIVTQTIKLKQNFEDEVLQSSLVLERDTHEEEYITLYQALSDEKDNQYWLYIVHELHNDVNEGQVNDAVEKMIEHDLIAQEFKIVTSIVMLTDDWQKAAKVNRCFAKAILCGGSKPKHTSTLEGLLADFEKVSGASVTQIQFQQYVKKRYAALCGIDSLDGTKNYQLNKFVQEMREHYNILYPEQRKQLNKLLLKKVDCSSPEKG